MYDLTQKLVPIYFPEYLNLEVYDVNPNILVPEFNRINGISYDFQAQARIIAINYLKSICSHTIIHSIRLRALVEYLKTIGKVSILSSSVEISTYNRPHNLILKVSIDEIDNKNDFFIVCNSFVSEDCKFYPSLQNEKDDNDEILIADSVTIIHKADNSLIKNVVEYANENLTFIKKNDDIFVEMIIQTNEGLTTQRITFDFNYSADDLDLHYGNGFSIFHNKLVERINENSKGLIMFHGKPGNGKTHYIRRLMSNICMNKRIILIPKNILNNLESPAFNLFMLQNFAGDRIVFVIEDAESIITNKSPDGSGRSELTSTLLNITDGILNDIFNIQVILTFNTDILEIDKALLRKGRLLAKHEFKNLSTEEAKLLAKHIGVSLAENKPEYSLAEIYSQKDIGDDEILIDVKSKQKSDKKILGFN